MHMISGSVVSMLYEPQDLHATAKFSDAANAHDRRERCQYFVWTSGPPLLLSGCTGWLSPSYHPLLSCQQTPSKQIGVDCLCTSRSVAQSFYLSSQKPSSARRGRSPWWIQTTDLESIAVLFDHIGIYPWWTSDCTWDLPLTTGIDVPCHHSDLCVCVWSHVVVWPSMRLELVGGPLRLPLCLQE